MLRFLPSVPSSASLRPPPRPAPPCISGLMILPRLSPLSTCTKISFKIYMAGERKTHVWGENLNTTKLRSKIVLITLNIQNHCHFSGSCCKKVESIFSAWARVLLYF